MQKITPHLWFAKEAKQAAEFYAAVFPDSRVTHASTIKDTPSGDTEIVSFTIMGYDFMAISAGPVFKINPSISFHIRCKTPEEVNALWEKLSPEGVVRMELGTYPFSKRYGWVEDRFGVSWQLICTEGDFTQRVMPMLMFVKDVCGKTEEAANFYTSIFQNAKIETLSRYEEGDSPVDKPGTIKYAQFVLEGQEFGAMDSAAAHDFAFNEAISFIVSCETQEEIDRYWSALSAVPQAEQCGWLKDKFGVSWQVVPTAMNEMMSQGTPEQIGRVTQAFLQMKKFDIAKLKAAFEGK